MAMPDLVVSRMAKALRDGRVLIDWSQANGKKTTIAPYSLRGRTRPTVAAPRTWEEIHPDRLAHLDYRDVLDRITDGLDPMDTLRLPEALTTAVGQAPAPPHPRTAVTTGGTRPTLVRGSTRTPASRRRRAPGSRDQPSPSRCPSYRWGSPGRSIWRLPRPSTTCPDRTSCQVGLGGN